MRSAATRSLKVLRNSRGIAKLPFRYLYSIKRAAHTFVFEPGVLGLRLKQTRTRSARCALDARIRA
jgi:hypothetical protein